MLNTVQEHAPDLTASMAAPPPSLTVAEAIVQQLQLWGVQRIYGVIGDAIFGLADALAKQDRIAFISVKHESVAAFMASAEAKLTGQLGVCIAQMGPGLTNLMNGLGDAFLDKAPVLAITGDAPLNKIGTPYKQFINQQQLLRTISPQSQLVVHPDAVMTSLTMAMSTSIMQRTVSHLSIPADLFHMATVARPSVQPHLSAPIPVPEGIQRVLQMMQSAKQPMLLVGSEAELEREIIEALAEAWGSGIVISYGAIGVVPDSHPYMLGGIGEGGNPFLTDLFKKADVVLCIATAWWPDGYVPSHASVIQIQLHQADLGIPVPIDAGLYGELARIMPQLTAGMKSHKPNQNWIKEIQQCKRMWSDQNELEGNPKSTSKAADSAPLPPSEIIRAIEQSAADDAIIALDEGDSTLWFLRNFRGKQQRVLLSERWRTMGFGLPAAMAAKLCSPQKQVICITGDGGLGMVLADLLTAVKYKLAITVVIFNNGGMQMERDKMLSEGLQPEGTTIINPNFVKLAEACGWHAYPVESINHLQKALQEAHTQSTPVLLDVRTAPTPFPQFNPS